MHSTLCWIHRSISPAYRFWIFLQTFAVWIWCLFASKHHLRWSPICRCKQMILFTYWAIVCMQLLFIYKFSGKHAISSRVIVKNWTIYLIIRIIGVLISTNFARTCSLLFRSFSIICFFLLQILFTENSQQSPWNLR